MGSGAAVLLGNSITSVGVFTNALGAELLWIADDRRLHGNLTTRIRERGRYFNKVNAATGGEN